MKKIKNGMLAVALLAGITGALATKTAQASNKLDTFYDWTSTSIAPHHPNSVKTNATRATAVSYFGCENGSQVCATGERVSGPGPLTDEIDFN